MKGCDCGKEVTVVDGADIDYNGGFLTQTVEICLDCKHLTVSHYSFGYHVEGRDYEDYDGSFESYDDQDELKEWIEEVSNKQ